MQGIALHRFRIFSRFLQQIPHSDTRHRKDGYQKVTVMEAIQSENQDLEPKLKKLLFSFIVLYVLNGSKIMRSQ